MTQIVEIHLPCSHITSAYLLNVFPFPVILGTFTSYFKGGDPGLPPERPSPSRSVSPRRNTHVLQAHTSSPLYASSSPVGVSHGTFTPSQSFMCSPVSSSGRETSYGTPPTSSRLAPLPAPPPKSKFYIIPSKF